MNSDKISFDSAPLMDASSGGRPTDSRIEFSLSPRGPFVLNLMDAAFDGLCMVDNSFHITFANEEMGKLLGRRREELGGLSFLDAVAENWRAHAVAAHERLRRGIKEKFELDLLHSSGEPVRALINASRISSVDGNFAGAILMISDITEQRKTEAALRKSAERLSTIIRRGSFLVVVTRLSDGYLLDVNEAMLKATGYARDELIGKTTVELGVLSPETRREVVERIRNEGHIEDFEMRITAKSGDARYGLFSMTLIEIDGEPCIMAIGADITRRKQAEEALRASEENYRELVESANSIILRVDARHRLIFVNQYAEKFFGYDREELLGKSIFGTILPEKESSGRDLVAMAKGMVADPLRYETNINENLRKNGERVLVAWTNRPVFDEHGRFKEVLAIGNDITDRRRAEEALRMSEARFRAMFQGAAIGMGLVNNDGRLVMTNPAFQDMLGHSDRELIGSYFKGFLHPKDINLFYGCFEDFDSGKRDRFETECRFLHSEGKVIWGSVTISLVQDDGQAPRYTIAMVEDITERKRAEEALKDSRESMRSLAARLESIREEERRGISREIHDELGQSLTALKIDLAWLEKRLAKPIHFEGSELRGKVSSMMELVNKTMQSVHRISSDLRPGVLDDLGLLPAVEWLLQKFKERTGIEYRLVSGPDNVQLDQDVSTAIFRILQESLTNVTRHAQATLVDVDLMISNNWLILKVVDNGRGITQAEASNPESLGLLGMRERAVSLGGSLGISSQKGKGTSLEVRLPLTHGDIPK